MAEDDEQQWGPVKEFVSNAWRGSMAASLEGMTLLRQVWPELGASMPEKTARQISRALDAFEAATQHLHDAGAEVLGEEDYTKYLETRAERNLNG